MQCRERLVTLQSYRQCNVRKNCIAPCTALQCRKWCEDVLLGTYRHSKWTQQSSMPGGSPQAGGRLYRLHCIIVFIKHGSTLPAPTANGQECEKTLVRLASTYREPFRVAAQRREASLPPKLLSCVAGVAGSKVHPLHQMSSSSQQACSIMLISAATRLPLSC